MTTLDLVKKDKVMLAIAMKADRESKAKKRGRRIQKQGACRAC